MILAAAIYGGVSFLTLAMVAFGLIPKTQWNTTQSSNTIGSVKMRPAEYYVATNQSMLGVYAQERTECFLKWIMFFTILGAFIQKTNFYFRQSEFIGHAAEIVTAPREDFDLEAYFHAEAERTYNNKDNYANMIGDMSLTEFKKRLRRRFFIARVLVALQPTIKKPSLK